MACSVVAPPFLVLQNVEHGVEAGDLVLHHGGGEDGGQRLVAEILGIAPRADDEAAAARDGLGQADGAEMHALGKTRRNDEPGAARTLGAERVGLIDYQRCAVAFADLDQLRHRRHVAVGAVERVDGDEARAIAASILSRDWGSLWRNRTGVAPALMTPSCSEICAFMSR